jgi:hypothetical protein
MGMVDEYDGWVWLMGMVNGYCSSIWSWVLLIVDWLMYD